MTDRLEWLTQGSVLAGVAAVVIVGVLGLLLGFAPGPLGGGILVGTIAVLGYERWTYQKSAEETGGDRNRQQTPTKHN